MGINDEKLKEDFVDFAVGLRRFPALPVKFEFQCDIRVRKPVSIKHRLRTGYKIRTRYKMRTGKYGLGIKHGLGIKRGLQTADWV